LPKSVKLHRLVVIKIQYDSALLLADIFTYANLLDDRRVQFHYPPPDSAVKVDISYRL